MDYRQLGRTGVQVSPLCLGCMMFGRRTSPEDSYAIIDRALDALDELKLGLLSGTLEPAACCGSKRSPPTFRMAPATKSSTRC